MEIAIAPDMPTYSGGLGVLYFAARMCHERTSCSARVLLLATVFYLPALLCVMISDRCVV